jgi:hypothetical protein
MKQQSFDFDDAPRSHPRNDLQRPPQPPLHGSSICHYCGERIPASLMDSSPSVADDQRWAMITPYHNYGCRWIERRGFKLEEGPTAP